MNRYRKFLLACFFAPVVWADVSDEFKRYVDRIIPWSHDLARSHAYQQEMSVFVNRLSTAQSTLARASDAALMISYYSNLLPTDLKACPKSNTGTVDIREVLRQLFHHSQVIAFTEQIDRQTANYKQLRKNFDEACHDGENFRAYEIEQLRLNLYFPLDIETWDGVYVEVSAGRGSSGGVSDIPVVGGVLQLIANAVENSYIRAERKRLTNGVVNVQQLRSYASDNCKQISSEYGNDAFASLHPLLAQLEATREKFDIEPVRGRHRFLYACVSRAEEESVERLRAEAHKVALARLGDDRVSMVRSGKLLKLHERINLNLLNLRQLNCTEGTQKVEDLTRDLSHLEAITVGDKDELGFVHSKRAAMRAWNVACAEVTP